MADTVWIRQVRPEELAPVAGLQGRWKRYLTAARENRAMVFGMGELQPGEVAGWHEHPEPEIFFVFEGRGEARWREAGQERRGELRPGVAFFKVGGIPHQMINTGDAPLRGVFFKVETA